MLNEWLLDFHILKKWQEDKQGDCSNPVSVIALVDAIAKDIDWCPVNLYYAF
jgi:hypothetical protein